MPGGRARVTFPSMPKFDKPDTDLQQWIRSLQLQLERFFHEASYFIPDMRLLGRGNTQQIANGFTINPEEAYVELIATEVVVSDPTVAIRVSEVARPLILLNACLFNITIKNNAKTVLSGGVDAVLTPQSSLAVYWSINLSKWIQYGGVIL